MGRFLFDTELAIEILTQVHRAGTLVLQRFESIQNPDDFYNSESGHEKLDAICMQLIVIGESLKNLDKITNSQLLVKYPQIIWKNVKGMRDIISHHYFDLDAEAVYQVCHAHIPQLIAVIEQMLRDLENKSCSEKS